MTHHNRFGMFIHWGFYALTELQEQAFVRHDIPREEYEALQFRFNPTEYDPEQWVLLAKRCGMQYICFTAKHHDGFCMWDTKVSDYSIMHTPYGKDVLKQLSDACRKHGMQLSLYYSVPDWHHPHSYNPRSTHQWGCVQTEGTDFEIYRAYIRDQVTELLTNYGKIYTFFWDIPPAIFDPSMNELVRQLQPGIFINNRGFDPGDFATPEREYEKLDGTARFTSMTEACNAIDVHSWGYRSDTDFYSLRHLLSSIDGIMARGGSYLLNIGPTAAGTLDPAHVARLEAVGDWYNRMEGCLEAHEAEDFTWKPSPACTCISARKNGKTYLHFPGGIPAECISFRDYPAVPFAVRLMNTGAQLPFCTRTLSGYFNGKTGRADREYLHIRSIPSDALASEPIVLELTW